MSATPGCQAIPNKTLYWAVTAPYLLMQAWVTVFLAGLHPLVAVIFVMFYVLQVLTQAYLCAVAPCPYSTGMCPGIFGMFPVGYVASLLRRNNVVPSRTLHALCSAGSVFAMIATIFFPMFWIALHGVMRGVAYAMALGLYCVVFLMVVCPGCIKQEDCAMGTASLHLRRWRLR